MNKEKKIGNEMKKSERLEFSRKSNSKRDKNMKQVRVEESRLYML